MKKTVIALWLSLCMILLLTACADGNNGTTTAQLAMESETTVSETSVSEMAVPETTESGFDLSLLNRDEAPATWDNVSWMKDTSPVKMTLFVDDKGYTGGMDGWGNDDISQEITRRTGVTLDVYSAAWSGFPEQPHEKSLPLMLASDELTDFVFTRNSLNTLQNSDICYPWDVLIAEYCPELFDLVDPLEIINNIAPDGHFYTLKTEYKDERTYADDRSIDGDYHTFTLSYRADILDRLGLPMFTSVEEMDKTLYEIKAEGSSAGLNIAFYHEPNSANAIAYYMGCQMENLWDQKEKSIVTKYRDDSWLEYYKLMNRWYRDGILPEDYLDINKVYEHTYAMDIFAYASSDHIHSMANAVWRQDGTGGRYDDFSQPVYELMQQHLTYNGQMQVELMDYNTGNNSLFISKGCSNPERAICFAEFLKSPAGDKLTCWGIEDVHYKAQDGLWESGLVNMNDTESVLKAGWYTWAFQQSGWAFGVRAAEMPKPEDDEYGYREMDAINRYGLMQKKLMYEQKNPAMSYAYISTDDMEYELLEKIEARWQTLNGELITAESEAMVETLWTDFQHYIEVNGVHAIEKRMTQRYLDNLTRYQGAGYYTDVAQ